MKRVLCAIIVGLCVLFPGCPVRSLSPLFHDGEIVFDPTLIGTWESVESSETFMFEKWGNKKYIMMVKGKDGDTSKYNADLGKIGTTWFLDVYPSGNRNDYLDMPTHMIARMLLGKDTMKMALLEGDWMEEMIESGKLTISHWRNNREMVLTASTDELQRVVRQYADDEKAYPDTSVLVRQKK